MAASSAAVCLLSETVTYYNASLASTPGTVGLYDFVYSDAYGSTQLPAGFYLATGSITGGNDWFEVDADGVVISLGVCTPPYYGEITFTSQEDTPNNYTVYMTVTGGLLSNSVGASGTFQGYTDTACSILSDTGSFSALTLTPPLSPFSQVNIALSGNPHIFWQSRKLTSLLVESTPITSNPQDIVVGGNTYRIVGFDVCDNT
jgi:hypothetical protein